MSGDKHDHLQSGGINGILSHGPPTRHANTLHVIALMRTTGGSMRGVKNILFSCGGSTQSSGENVEGTHRRYIDMKVKSERETGGREDERD